MHAEHTASCICPRHVWPWSGLASADCSRSYKRDHQRAGLVLLRCRGRLVPQSCSGARRKQSRCRLRRGRGQASAQPFRSPHTPVLGAPPTASSPASKPDWRRRSMASSQSSSVGSSFTASGTASICCRGQLHRMDRCARQLPQPFHPQGLLAALAIHALVSVLVGLLYGAMFANLPAQVAADAD